MSDKTLFAGFVVVLLATATIAGCAKPKPEVKMQTAEGKALSINLDTGEVAMEAWLAGPKRYQKVSGIVDDQTEVMINGRPAKLADVKPGDAVKVIGYTKGEGLNKKWVAVKINVILEDLFADDKADTPAMPETADAPATDPVATQ